MKAVVLKSKYFELRVTIEEVINTYLVLFLVVDAVNGLFLRILNLGEALSFGQLVRLFIFVLLNYYLICVNKKFSIHILITYLLIGFTFFIYVVYNDFKLSFIFFDCVFYIKILLYPLIILYSYLAIREEVLVHKMVNITFWIYSASILVTFLTGTGIQGYDTYEASKGFFYANNATAILGLVLGLYFLFHQKNLRKALITLLVLFFSGSKIFLFYGLLIFLHFLQLFFRKLWTAKASLLLYVVLLIFLAVSSGIIYQKVWVERYEKRVNSVLLNAERAGLFRDMDVFSYYAFLSLDRAINTKAAINYLNKNRTAYLFGLGAYHTKFQIFDRKEDIENDLIDMLSMYGLIGMIVFLYFHFKIFLNVRTSIAPIVLFVFIYSVLAGHYIYNPMSYTLPAVLFGFYYLKPQETRHKELARSQNDGEGN